MNEAHVQKITSGDPETQSEDILGESVAQLGELFPDAVVEGRIDFDVLRQLLGDAVEDREEKYGLDWHGKRRARQIALTPSTGTLRPCPEESLDWETTQNLMIEGDNLEVLKLLQKSYAGRVKLIYIDPPYNTGDDFIYPDDFRNNTQNYLRLTGQLDEAGQRLGTNTEASGRFHTEWMNMMYPRLRLARNLLSSDGVMFTSIDDTELANLQYLLRDIFGEESIQTLVWRKAGEGRDGKMKNTATARVDHDYVVAAFRGEASLSKALEMPDFRGEYSNPDSDPRGNWLSGSMSRSEAASNPNHANYYEVTSPSGTTHRRQWEVPPEEFRRLDAEGRVYWGPDGTNVPRLKIFLNEPRYVTPSSLLLRQGSTSQASRELDALLECDGLGESLRPKPVTLVQYLIGVGARDDSIVLDFFAGSGTTGHAVMLANALDGGSRRFVLVQLPEALDPTSRDQQIGAEYCDGLGLRPTLAEITKERLRRAGTKIREEDLPFARDAGFRVFKLDSTNIQAWEPERDDLETTLEAAVDHLRSDRTEHDILYELLLKLGLDLSVPIETRVIAGREVSAVGGGALIVCLAPSIGRPSVEELANGIAEWLAELAPAGDATCVFRDSAFEDDVAKTNAAAILAQRGVTRVRSL